MKVKTTYYIIALLLLIVGQAGAQTKLEGRVLDSQTDEPIIGATVAVVDEHSGVLTDLDGNFSVTVRNLPAVIKVSFVGYRELQVDVYDASEPIVIPLTEAVDVLQEVVVVGYSTQKRRELTSAISTVNKDLLKQSPTTVENALAGAVAGLNVTTTSGQPGASSNIRIRGGNSITGSNEPLYVIDGFIVYNDPEATRTGASGADASLDPLSFLNPSDIESIEVLKDVSATAIYGTRGANGVIMITTKKGTKGRNNLRYAGTAGWSTAARRLEFLNAEQFTALYNEINPKAPLPSPTHSYDWQDEALRTAFTQEHQLSAAGGDEHSRYAISGSYKGQEGIIVNTGLKRYAGRINYERTMWPNFVIGVNASGAYSALNGLRNVDRGTAGQAAKWASNTWMAVITSAPTHPIYDAAGHFNYAPSPISQDLYTRNGEQVVGNPISDLYNAKTRIANSRLIASAFAEWEPVKHLKLKVQAGADLSNTRESNYSPSYTTTGLEYKGVASVGSTLANVWQAEFTANYDREFDRLHHVALLAGYTAQRTDRSGYATTVRNFANDVTGYNNLAAGSDLFSATSRAYISTLRSWLGRANYSYDGRYNLSLTLRADGSSRFAENNKWGLFPSAGLSWNVGREKFIRLGRAVDHLQVRLSAGVVGNQEIGDYQFVANVAPTPTPGYSGGREVLAYYIQSKANPDLKWERTASYNVGLSTGFFRNRLTVVLDAYYKRTSDLLLMVPVEQVSGFETSLRNVGSVTNRGVELAIGGTLVSNKQVRWTADFNIAHNRNEVTSLGSASSIVPNFSGATLGYISPVIVKVGEPLGTLYGYKFKGLVQKETDVSALPRQSISPLRPGNPIYEDVNGDNVVNTADQTVLGNSQPLFTYGFNTTLTWGRVDLFLALAGSYGNKLFNGLATRLTKGSTYYNSLAIVADRWTETNPSDRIQRASDDLTIVSDSRYVEDASYLRLKNVQVGYTLPLRQVTKDAQIRLFLSLQNFVTLTRYSGYDPEASRNGMDEHSALYQGVDMGTYPTAKTVQVGLQLTL